jgi:hypothetical protein
MYMLVLVLGFVIGMVGIWRRRVRSNKQHCRDVTSHDLVRMINDAYMKRQNKECVWTEEDKEEFHGLFKSS